MKREKYGKKSDLLSGLLYRLGVQQTNIFKGGLGDTGMELTVFILIKIGRGNSLVLKTAFLRLISDKNIRKSGVLIQF